MASGNPSKSGKHIDLPEATKFVQGTGFVQEAVQKYGANIPVPPKGEHLWTITGLWKINEPSKVASSDQPVQLDLENLLTIDGPGCYVCEQMWTPEIEKQPCPGEQR